jgi:hypothetical protein
MEKIIFGIKKIQVYLKFNLNKIFKKYNKIIVGMKIYKIIKIKILLMIIKIKTYNKIKNLIMIYNKIIKILSQKL